MSELAGWDNLICSKDPCSDCSIGKVADQYLRNGLATIVDKTLKGHSVEELRHADAEGDDDWVETLDTVVEGHSSGEVLATVPNTGIEDDPFAVMPELEYAVDSVKIIIEGNCASRQI